jgi:NTE family protein
MEQLLRRHLQLEKLPGYPRLPAFPQLLVGVTNVLEGEGTPLRGETLTYGDIIASAAIPPLFRAVRMRGSSYWDGLFNRNPPIREFTDMSQKNRPDEIWLIRLSPKSRKSEPMSMPEIVDRRNELAGNLAVDQELYHISRINDLLREKALKKDGYKSITLREVQQTGIDVDYASKLDRSPWHLRRLFHAGIAAAGRFFTAESEIGTQELEPAAKSRPGVNASREAA